MFIGWLIQTSCAIECPDRGKAANVSNCRLCLKVEFTTVKKSEEKRSDVGLITIKTFTESRPFTVKAVVDVSTDKQLSVQEAQAAGILDQKRSVYHNKITGDKLSLSDALDSGLLVVEFEKTDSKNGFVHRQHTLVIL